jgi:hypothetical protein
MAAPPAATATNAADFYRKAFALYDALSDQEKNSLGDWRTQLEADQAAQLCGKVAPILDLMHQAAAVTNCDWGTGPITVEAAEAFLPYLNRGRALARTANWSAAHCRAGESGGATDDLLSSLQVAHNLSQFAMIGFLVDTAIQGITTAFIAENAWKFSNSDTTRLIRALNDPQYEEDLYRAIEQEADLNSSQRKGNQLPPDFFIGDTLTLNSPQRKGDQLPSGVNPELIHAGPEGQPMVAVENPLPSGVTPEMIRQTADFVREFATVLAQPDAQYQQWLSRVQAAQESNPYLKEILPTMQNVVDKARAGVVTRTMTLAGLAVLQSGQESLLSYPDPSTGQPFQYQETADGFQLQSVYQIKGQPVTMTFRQQKNAAPSN